MLNFELGNFNKDGATHFKDLKYLHTIGGYGIFR